MDEAVLEEVAAFIEARLAEDEEKAELSGPAVVAWLTFSDDQGRMLYTTVASTNLYEGDILHPWVADGHEVPAPASARVVYDPARVRRSAAATRLLVTRIQAMPHHYVDEDTWYSCRLAVAPGETEPGSGKNPEAPGQGCECGRDWRVGALLHAVAARWGDHPDYQADWADVPAWV